MKYRLIALDLDGTLLDNALRIRASTVDALRRARGRGVQAMIVTGRHHSAVRAYWQELALDLPAICCNGGYIYDFRAGRALAGDAFSRDEARRLLGIVRSQPVDAMIYTDSAMTCEHDLPHLTEMRRWLLTLEESVRPRIEEVASLDRVIDEAEAVWKFLIASRDQAALEAFLAAARAGGFHGVRSSSDRVDVARPGNSKGKRLAEFIAGRGIAPEEIIAFGDQSNDKEMLELAGLGVAMGNSRSEVRALADWVTGPNDADGIADAIERFVLV
jgi:Cof subfamily protein (haloacid dehalogenase superfamily)